MFPTTKALPCPKRNPKIKKMFTDGTIFCYMAYLALQCSDVACCEDCKKVKNCPIACKMLKENEAKEYIS